jgi:hypothetical protein
MNPLKILGLANPGVGDLPEPDITTKWVISHSAV